MRILQTRSSRTKSLPTMKVQKKKRNTLKKTL
jgi:hypothetical protein